MSALVWSPFADEESAATAAGILPPMRSLFVWQGQRGDQRECAAVFKTSAALLDRAVARLAQIHPYESPAILGWKADAVAPATAAWLDASGEAA